MSHDNITDAIIAARNEALEDAAKVCEQEKKVFGSNEYALGQPQSSFGERFACGVLAEKIRGLKK